MKIVNFSHPLSPDQIGEIEAMMGEPVEEVVEVNSHIDFDRPLPEQIRRMVDSADVDWAADDLVVNAPSLAISAVLVTAEIYRRRFEFLPVLQLVREDGIFPKWHVAAVLKP